MKIPRFAERLLQRTHVKHKVNEPLPYFPKCDKWKLETI